MRNVCISSVVFDEQSVSLLGTPVIRDQLPNAVLYWDQITVPIFARGFSKLLDADLEVLEDSGSAIGWVFKDKNSFTPQDANAFTDFFLDGVSQRLQDKEHSWSLVTPTIGGKEINNFSSHLASRLGGLLTKRQALTVAFLDALPVCPPDTPFEDIVAFKRIRADNLNNLHEAVSLLSVSLSGADNIEDALRAGSAEIARALSDLDKVVSERWSSRVLTAMRTNVGSIMAGAATGAIAGGAGGLSVPFTALAGGAIVPAIEAVVNSIATPRALPDRASPYFYAIDARNTLRR